MIRVYDNKERCWLHGDFCISNNRDLMQIKNRPFGMDKIELLSDTRYAWHEDIGAYDSIGNLIFEGDICKIDFDEDTVYCVVAYVEQRAAYLLFDEKNLSYYSFNNYTNERLSVVSNVFDGQSILDCYANVTEEEE